ncbi:alpha-1,2-mannosyltransferase [Metschnikowia aff. pulcherrima]|uniref:GDP-Man:Man(3)GlcNAc(2)-PP-Dol alpha-1,2-mannosyltransferase n=1 Tax=Metschnikowia aff. pulcherrima TaxID=2163413 RepID=A0A4P6XVW4_9ASCO|nr:alpha-1,2-mannosyltransferase [Metschnikowia aff. pulcherrima]
MFNIPLYLIPIAVTICLYQAITLGLPRFFLVPTHNWKNKILKVVKHTKPIYLKVGTKRLSFRRRLITASVQPSFYTNFVNNKLKLQPEDAANENDDFINKMSSRAPADPKRRVIYGFFHPYANNGGGGEKVLWQAVLATLGESERNIVAVYTSNTDAEPLQILAKAESKFKVTDLDSKRIVFVYLRRYASYIDGSYWKHFTLAGQLFGSVLLGLEAMYELSPDVWIDTMGLPGSYWLVAWILKIPIVAYVHYPIIQPDMFSRLKFQCVKDVSGLKFTLTDFKHFFKFTYWSLLYYVYIYLGLCVDVTLTNGTWTYDHISAIWAFNKSKTVEIVYPPCSTEDMMKDVKIETRQNKLLYIAQFRPEKRHDLVLEKYEQFVGKFRHLKLPLAEMPTLVFLGSCRTQTDSSTLDMLREKVTELDLTEYVEFVVDCSFDEVKHTLSTCKFGLNAMWNEHFGIGVVEYLSAGVVPIVHASAGPLLDIVRLNEPAKTWKNEVGFFFKSESDPDFTGTRTNNMLDFTIRGTPSVFPELDTLLEMLFVENREEISDPALQAKRDLGQKLALERFSNSHFALAWKGHIRQVARMEVDYRETRRDKVDMVY